MISLSAVVVAYAQPIAGTWQGTLPVGQSRRVVLRIADAGNGALRGSVIFIDRAADAVPLLSMVYRAPNPLAAIFDITFRGKLNADGKSIAGTWTEGNQSFPVSFATEALQRLNVSAPSVNDILISPRELEDGTTAVQFSHTTMPEFTEFLMGWIQDRQIVDETHLNGRFDFTVMIPTSSLFGGSDNDKAMAFPRRLSRWVSSSIRRKSRSNSS